MKNVINLLGLFLPFPKIALCHITQDFVTFYKGDVSMSPQNVMYEPS